LHDNSLFANDYCTVLITPQCKYVKLGIRGAGSTIFRVALAAGIRSSCSLPTAWEAAGLGGGSDYHCQRKMQSRPTHQSNGKPCSARVIQAASSENRRWIGKANNQMGGNCLLCFATRFRILFDSKANQENDWWIQETV